jgi:serine protease Do
MNIEVNNMFKPRFNRLSVGILIMGMALVVIVSGHGMGRASAAELPVPHKQFVQPEPTTSFAEVFEEVNPAVVTISVSKSAAVEPAVGFQHGPGMMGPPGFDDFFGRFFNFPMQPQAQAPVAALGSGFFIDEDGYIVTNNHVIENADDISVVLADGSRLDAELVGRDPKTDLALIKVSAEQPFPALHFGNSDQARVGDWVLAIGNPFGLGGTATAGIISARGRDIRSGPYDDYLQIDAPINAGNSGGPIVNADGDVIGVNTAIYSPNGGNVGIGFAIPASQASEIVEDLKVNRVVHRGWLGVQIQGLDEDLAKSLGRSTDEGALVAAVTDGSPADKAGITAGDVITKFGDHDIDSPKTLSFAVADQDPGSTARVHVWRNGKDKTLKVTVSEMEETGDLLAANGPEADTAGKLGLRLAPLTDAYRARLGAPKDVDGVVVEAVQPGSEAARKGLRPGDLITAVNGNEVTSPGTALHEMEAGNSDRALLLVRRGDSQYFAALALS